jgi:hypothetical protein
MTFSSPESPNRSRCKGARTEQVPKVQLEKDGATCSEGTPA